MEPISMSKNEFLALFHSQVPTRHRQALDALEDRKHQMSGYSIGRICESVQWIKAGELWQCGIVVDEKSQYEQRLNIQGFEDEKPAWMISGAWLDVAGTFYNRVRACAGGLRQFEPTIISNDVRQTDKRHDGGIFKLAGDGVMSRRRQKNEHGELGPNPAYMEKEVTLKSLLRDTHWGERLGFSKGRVIALLKAPDGSVQEMRDRMQFRILGHKNQCGAENAPEEIDNAMSGDNIYFMSDATVFRNTGYVLLRHPDSFRNPAAAARIKKARLDLQSGLIVKRDGDWRYKADLPEFAAAA